ncbi:hypothetical protein RB195_005394 [Necator americanus]|uniref:Uncharacterized protein n=1 Tax=Necator americanus TaxID=51031 RepID=A0ABR1BR21_NECAM
MLLHTTTLRETDQYEQTFASTHYPDWSKRCSSHLGSSTQQRNPPPPPPPLSHRNNTMIVCSLIKQSTIPPDAVLYAL